MPILNPGSNDYKPKYWRNAYDAFINFRRAVSTVSTKIKKPIDVSSWHITVPGRFKGMADPRWQLTFTNIDGRVQTVYIGSDGMTARKTIRDIHDQYIKILVEQGRSRTLTTDPRKLQERKDPRFDHNVINRMMQRWNAMQKVKSVAEWEDNVRENPDVVRFMQSRAGFLDMTMADYLYKHPMSHKWPTPPTTKQQLDARIRQDEDYERSLHKVTDISEANTDDGPGWMGG